MVLSGSHRAADDAERRAVAGRGQRAGVAVRQDARVRPARPRRRTRPSPGSSPRPRRGSAAPRASSRAFQLVHRLAGLRAARERLLHPLDGPEQVDGGGPRRRHQRRTVCGTRWRTASCRSRCCAHAERHPHGGGDANGRRAANHHGLDGLGDVVRGLAGDVDFCRRAACAGRSSPRRRLSTRSSEASLILVVRLGLSAARRPAIRSRRVYSSRASNGSGSRSLQLVTPGYLRCRLASIDFEVAAELPQDLPAGAARRRRRVGVGDDGDRA